MKIKMRETKRGADDGFTVREYAAGVEYDLSRTPRARDLAAVFVGEGWAEEVPDKISAPAAPPAITEPPASPSPVVEPPPAATAVAPAPVLEQPKSRRDRNKGR